MTRISKSRMMKPGRRVDSSNRRSERAASIMGGRKALIAIAMVITEMNSAAGLLRRVLTRGNRNHWTSRRMRPGFSRLSPLSQSERLVGIAPMPTLNYTAGSTGSTGCADSEPLSLDLLGRQGRVAQLLRSPSSWEERADGRDARAVGPTGAGSAA